jgi:hypothetical protein
MPGGIFNYLPKIKGKKKGAFNAPFFCHGNTGSFLIVLVIEEPMLAMQ